MYFDPLVPLRYVVHLCRIWRISDEVVEGSDLHRFHTEKNFDAIIRRTG